MRAAIVLALVAAVAAVEVRSGTSAEVSTAGLDAVAGTVRGTMLRPDLTVSTFTEDHRLDYQALLARKFGTESGNVNVTVLDASDGESVRLHYSVTGLLDVVASNRVVEEIFDGGEVFSAASLAIPVDGSYSVSYWSAPGSPAHVHHSSFMHAETPSTCTLAEWNAMTIDKQTCVSADGPEISRCDATSDLRGGSSVAAACAEACVSLWAWTFPGCLAFGADAA